MNYTTLASRSSEPIDVESVERELAAMWRSASPGGATGAQAERPPVLRACRTNLVVLGEPTPSYVDEVTLRHPARLITVGAAAESAAQALSAHVSALCHWGSGGGLVCSERIAIAVGPGAESRVASAIRSLAVGDLPIVVHGRAAAVAPYAESGMLSAADRLILDASGAPLETWLRIAEAMPGRADAITDLAWLRLRPFRTFVARAMARSGFRKSIARLESVDVAHASDPAAALLLAGWIADRLRMGRPRVPRSPAGAENALAALDFPGRGRRIRLRFGPAPAGESLVLVLRTPDMELRAAIEPPAAASVVIGPGRVRLLPPGGERSDGPRGRGRRGGGGKQSKARPGGSPRLWAPSPRERTAMEWGSTAHLIVDALGHGAYCDETAPRVLDRALQMAAALTGRSWERRPGASIMVVA
jgi:hypothetical protein